MRTDIRISIVKSFKKEFLNEATSDKRRIAIVETMKQLGFKEEWEKYHKYLVNMGLAIEGLDNWSKIESLIN